MLRSARRASRKTNYQQSTESVFFVGVLSLSNLRPCSCLFGRDYDIIMLNGFDTTQDHAANFMKWDVSNIGLLGHSADCELKSMGLRLNV